MISSRKRLFSFSSGTICTSITTKELKCNNLAQQIYDNNLYLKNNIIFILSIIRSIFAPPSEMMTFHMNFKHDINPYPLIIPPCFPDREKQGGVYSKNPIYMYTIKNTVIFPNALWPGLTRGNVIKGYG